MKRESLSRTLEDLEAADPAVGRAARKYDEAVKAILAKPAPARSPFRWAGGKTKLLPELYKRLPEKFVGYHEPFVGGGALFWSLAADRRLKKGYVALSDTCEPLVRTYRALKADAPAVIKLLKKHPVTEEYFYAVRARDLVAMSDAEAAAWFIYMNKTNFNGLWRVNKAGHLNVPWGRWTTPPTVCDEPNLLACSEIMRTLQVALNSRPFESVLNYAKPGDLLYADPPYMPQSQTSDFTAYSKDGFGYDDHVRLRDVTRELKERGVHVMLSNSDVPLVRELYESWRGFKIDVVEAPRSINSKGSGRGAVRELIIR